MNYVSVCSGIEAATVAWHPLGWRPVAFSEIEKFPSAVLSHHYPSVPNLGDMTKYKEWDIESISVRSRSKRQAEGDRTDQHRPCPAHDSKSGSCGCCNARGSNGETTNGTINLVVGGTPCQAFSVAGLRKGLDDPRGNLSLVFLGLLEQVRPKWVVWENVPGVLSIDGGRAFGAFLGGLAQLGYGWAYRVLDAQYVRVDGYECAVPQRRRRVFVVGYSGDWRPPAAVLFERTCLSGHPAPSRKAGEGTSGTVKSGSGERGYPDPSDGNGGGLTVGALCASSLARQQQQSVEEGHYIPETVGTLSNGAHMGGGLNGQDAYTGRIIPCAAGQPQPERTGLQRQSTREELGAAFDTRRGCL